MKQDPPNSGSTLVLLLSVGPIGGLVLGATNLLLANLRSQGLLLPTLLQPSARWSVLKQSAVDVSVRCDGVQTRVQTETSCDLYSFFSPGFEWLIQGTLQAAAFAYSWGLAIAGLVLLAAGIVETMRQRRRQGT